MNAFTHLSHLFGHRFGVVGPAGDGFDAPQRAEREGVASYLPGLNNHDRETLLTAMLDPRVSTELRYSPLSDRDR